MKVSCESAYQRVQPADLVGKTAVVIDLLRASSTIITALSNGCDRIIPAEDPNEAVEIARSAEGKTLICGEVAAEKVRGFDLGNSPLEYTHNVVDEKVVILATTNGAAAIKHFFNVDHVLVAALINASAAAQKIVEIGQDCVLVCAGTDGQFSMDDIIAAGCIIDRLQRLNVPLELTDLCEVALRMYRSAQGNMREALTGCKHFEFLLGLRLFDDLEYCLREDTHTVVPVLRECIVRL